MVCENWFGDIECFHSLFWIHIMQTVRCLYMKGTPGSQTHTRSPDHHVLVHSDAHYMTPRANISSTKHGRAELVRSLRLNKAGSCSLALCIVESSDSDAAADQSHFPTLGMTRSHHRTWHTALLLNSATHFSLLLAVHNESLHFLSLTFWFSRASHYSLTHTEIITWIVLRQDYRTELVFV